MAISKIIYKSSAEATPEVWMDSTTATAAAADITAPKTAMLANGIMTTGTGSGGDGSTTAKESDVNFIDPYDGTIAYSYTTDEFAALTALPANPSHAGMIAQGWNMPSNWTLANAKAYIATNKRYNWGQMYTTDDGKTRIYIHLEKGRTSPMLGCCPNGTVDVDWGDDTTHDTLTGTSISTIKWTQTHNYAAPGDYIIKLTVTGAMGLYGASSTNQYSALLRYSNSADSRNRYYQSAIRRVEIGNNVTSIGNYTFSYCYNLTSVTIPNSVTSIGTNTFAYDYNFISVAIPIEITSISNYMFRNCFSLTLLSIPSSVTSIGTYAFHACYRLTSLTIPSGVTSVGTYAFYTCYGLTSLVIPDNVASFGEYTLYLCSGLTSFTIPSNITSIGNYVFYQCYSLTSLTIPSDVTSIGNYAFQNCYGLSAIHFKPSTPPTVSNSNAFTSIPSDCTIYVPTGSLSSYTSATNYPSSSTYTYVEE